MFSKTPSCKGFSAEAKLSQFNSEVKSIQVKSQIQCDISATEYLKKWI